MRTSVAADSLDGVAERVVTALRQRGHEVIRHGALDGDERDDWAWASEAAARDIPTGGAARLPRRREPPASDPPPELPPPT